MVASENAPGVFSSPVAVGQHYNCENGSPANAVANDGSGDVFIYGPNLYVSHDGGKSFAADPQPGTVLGLAAIGTSVWLLEVGCVQGQPSCQLHLFLSNDGGRTFLEDGSLPTVLLPSGRLYQYSTAAPWLLRANANQGYVLVPPSIGTSTAAEPQVERIYYTPDGGTDWSSSELSACAIASYVDVAVDPQGTLMAACAGQPGAGSQGKAILNSADHGATWTTSVDCLLVNTVCGQSGFGGGYVNSLAFPSPTTAFLGVERGQLLMSEDGGTSWHYAPGSAADAWDVSESAFFGSTGYLFGSFGVGGGPASIWTTSDLGQSWSRVPVKLAPG